MGGALVVLCAILVVQTPDSAAQARYHAGIQRINDSLTALQGSAAMFQADLVHASPDLVISRATRLRMRCTGTLRQIGLLNTMPAVGARLRRELAALNAELMRCDREFAIGPSYQGADSVKAWAPYRLARLGDAVRRFRLAARGFMREASSR